jgi:hypothetical protein
MPSLIQSLLLSPKKRLIPPSSIKDRCRFYDPLFIDVHTWDYNEEVALRENNERALEFFKEKYRDRLVKKERNVLSENFI